MLYTYIIFSLALPHTTHLWVIFGFFYHNSINKTSKQNAVIACSSQQTSLINLLRVIGFFLVAIKIAPKVTQKRFVDL